MTPALVALLLVAVAGALARPFRLPAFAVPAACAIAASAAGLVSLTGDRHALSPLLAPLGFLLAAIPLAMLLDGYGYFEQLASLFRRERGLVGGLWLLAAGTVAVLNLDAAVVLLTPLYVRIAARHGLSRRSLGSQPMFAALLCSSAIPVSNLTNLIAATRYSVDPLDFIEHLDLPVLVASLVGFCCYRLASKKRGILCLHPDGIATPEKDVLQRDARVLVVGSLVVGLLLVGFIVGPRFQVSPWELALGADLVLVAVTRRLPVSALPWQTVLLAASLAMLAAGATAHIDLTGLLGGSGPLSYLRQAALAAGGANASNNLPAFLVALPFVGHSGVASCSLWPVLWGVNAGPGLVVTGSLASLLWLESMRRAGCRISALSYMEMGARVVVPAALCGLAALIALAPAVGC